MDDLANLAQSQGVADGNEITRLRAALAERDKVICAMREALDEVRPYFEGEHHPDHPSNRIVHAALRLTPADLAGLCLVPRERMERLAGVLERHWDMWVKDGTRVGPSVSQAAAQELRAMIGEGDSHG